MNRKKVIVISLTAFATAAAVICLILILKGCSGHTSGTAAPEIATTETTDAMALATTTAATGTTAATDTAETEAASAINTAEAEAVAAEGATEPTAAFIAQTETTAAPVQEYLPESQTYTEAQSETATPELKEEPVTEHVHEWILAQAAYDEQVLEASAYDEQVQTGTKTIVDREAYDEEVDYGYYEIHTICDCGLDITETFGNTDNPEFWEHQDTHFDIMSGWYNEAVWISDIQNIHHEAVTHEEPVYGVIHHDAVYETVHHDAQYICSCGATSY